MGEKINIAELLTDCPQGMELYSPIFGKVYLDKIRPHLAIVVTTDKKQGDFKEEFLYDGRYKINGECMLFPSKGKTTWEDFQRPFNDGDKEVYEDDNNFPSFEPMFKMNDELEYKIPDGYEITEVSKDTVFIKPIKSKYPKTYDECCNELINYDKYREITVAIAGISYKANLINSFTKLLICRDAYWKIAGKQAGLGKPWESENPSRHYVFSIENFGGKIQKNAIVARMLNRILVFPTEELRDAFYENFKGLIEQCKELL